MGDPAADTLARGRRELVRLRGELANVRADRDFAIEYGGRLDTAARGVLRAWALDADLGPAIEVLSAALNGPRTDRGAGSNGKQKGQHMTDTETHEPGPAEEPSEEPTHEGPSGPEPELPTEPELPEG